MSATADDVRYAAGWHDGWLAALADARAKIEALPAINGTYGLDVHRAAVLEALAVPAPSRSESPIDFAAESEKTRKHLAERAAQRAAPAPSRQEQDDE